MQEEKDIEEQVFEIYYKQMSLPYDYIGFNEYSDGYKTNKLKFKIISYIQNFEKGDFEYIFFSKRRKGNN